MFKAYIELGECKDEHEVAAKPGYNSQRWSTARIFQISLNFFLLLWRS
jgi:hypothetical protein